MAATRKYATTSPDRTPRRSVTTEDFALKAKFEELATQFAAASASQLDVPIAHWAVASDRRLPYALLDRTVRQLTTASFGELLATPGVGRKKLAALLILLQRALVAGPAPRETAPPPIAASIAMHQEAFNAEQVSQVMWAEWQETVRRHDLHDEWLGRVAPSLQSLPTVIWAKPLGDYLRYTIDELRSLKTHGDKRVTAVLEVFHVVHSLLGHSARSSRVLAQLRPAFIPPVEQWLFGVLSSEEPPTAQEIRQHLVLPLLNQVERDAGETVHRLAAGRLGIESFPEGVRDQSRALGVTRARIYQLLEMCGDVMRIRWPAGRWMFQLLIQKLASHGGDAEALDLVESMQSLLYPTRRARTAAEPAIA
jgi:hypothetical protein